MGICSSYKIMIKKKYIVITPIGYLSCNPYPYMTFSNGKESKVLTIDTCHGDGEHYQSVDAIIDDPDFFNFIINSKELTLTTQFGDIYFDIRDNPY